MIELWKFFDSIYCINLFSRPDRYQKSKKIFDQLEVPVEYHQVEKHPTNGAEGCFDSHIQVITKSYNKGDQTCLIFEDDIILEVEKQKFREQLEIIIDFLKIDQDWELFFLGSLPIPVFFKTKKIGQKNIYQVHSLLAHAYVINRRLMGKLIGSKFSGVPIDHFYMWNDRAYTVYPSLFRQHPGVSSDVSSDAYFDLIFKIAEVYAYKINIPFERIVVGMFFLILLLLIILFLLFYKLYYRRDRF